MQTVRMQFYADTLIHANIIYSLAGMTCYLCVFMQTLAWRTCIQTMLKKNHLKEKAAGGSLDNFPTEY